MRNRHASSVLAAAVLALAVGCSAEHSPDTDGGIQLPDANSLPDVYTPPDAWTPPTIGRACTAPTDCGTDPTAQCVNDPDFVPGGYCTQTCNPMATDSCPTGSQCVNLGPGRAFCILECDPTVTTRQCGGRQGYGCTQDPMLSGLCFGGCVDSTDCPMGLMCDPAGGQLTSGACYTPGVHNGVACTADTQCGMGGACLTEDGNGWPGGTCTLPGCDAVNDMGCGMGEQCIPLNSIFGPPQGYCLQGCTMTSDCRAGYTCIASPTYPDRHYCAPGCTGNAQCTVAGDVCNTGLGTCAPPFTGTIGGMCSFRDPTTCEGGTCLSEFSSGFPGSMCSYSGCSATNPCPSGSTCAHRLSGSNVCLPSCTMPTDCRAGYACAPSDPADPTSATACMPHCASDMDCANASRGSVCNVGTGLCGRAFMGTFGAACGTDGDCAGGLCLTEANTGYPGGACTQPGCRLSGTGPGITCTVGSVCIDDHIGDPALGTCQQSCTGTECRAGYACVMGACQPACTATSCAAGRTCDMASGLCH